MEIRSVEFRTSAAAVAGVPGEPIPHVAFAGRSNVGKSSLLNWLWRRRLAKVAKTPGKTRLLNFFHVNGAFYMVDLPGYGYAKVAKATQAAWGRELTRYLSEEERLAAVVTLIDIRHPPTRLDVELQRMLLEIGVPRLVVLTKADKIGRSHTNRMTTSVQRQLKLALPPVVTSVTSGEGRRELLGRIGAEVERWHERRRGDDDAP